MEKKKVIVLFRCEVEEANGTVWTFFVRDIREFCIKLYDTFYEKPLFSVKVEKEVRDNELLQADGSESDRRKDC